MRNIEEVGKRIRQLRECKKISREELAEILELSDSYIGLIERGARGITLENLVKIANLFEVSLDYFVVESKEFTPSKQIQYLLKTIDSFNENDYNFIVNIVSELVQHLNSKSSSKSL